MNPIFAAGGALEEPFRLLSLALRDTGSSAIVLAVADDEIVRREAMAELGELLSGRYGLAELDFADAAMHSLPRYYRSLGKEAPVAVFAYGLEELRERDVEGYGEALHFLNAHREDFRLVPGAVILWLTTPALADVLDRAPDFADWRTGGATFELPEGEKIERTALGRLSIGEAEGLRRQVERFREMLGRPNLGTALRAEFEKQLDLAERRLGRVADVGRDYRLYLIDELKDLVLRGFAPQVGGRVLTLPLSEVFLPLNAVEGRPALAEVAEEDLGRQAGDDLLGELDWRQRRTEFEKRTARLKARQTAERSLTLAELLGERRAVLLGDPGSGKTTITRYVAWTLAAGETEHLGPGPRGRVPVLVRLANYGRALEGALAEGGDLDLVTYIGRELLPRPELGEHLAAAIRAGECLVILDGLDEISDPELRREVTQCIQTLVAEYGANRFLVTSRIVGYDRSPLTRGFRHATLRELGSEERERFVDLWYRAIRSKVSGSVGEAGEAALVEALRQKPQIARMGANPLLLTIMVLMHWRGVKLPSRRVQVYQNATETLIEYWTARRLGVAGGAELDAEEIKRILAPVAHAILSSSVGGVIARGDLLPLFHRGITEQRGCDEAEAEEIGRGLLTVLGEQSGIFLERGVGSDGEPVYGFLHQTFGEYLAALHLAEEKLSDTFELDRYIHRSAWREPLLLMVGHLSLVSPTHANRLLRQILDFPAPYEEILRRNVLLAGDILADDVQLRPALRQEVVEGLAALLVDPAPQLREEALKCFAALAVTRHRESAAGAAMRQVEDLVKNPVEEIRYALATALIRLQERELASPLLDGLERNFRVQQDRVLRLRLEGWPEKGADLLSKIRLRTLPPHIAAEAKIDDCAIGSVNLGWLQRVLGEAGLRACLARLSEQTWNRDEWAALQWVTALASSPAATDKMTDLLMPETPCRIRRLAATHLLNTAKRISAAQVLRELSGKEPGRETTLAARALLEAGEKIPAHFLGTLVDTALLPSSNDASEAIANLLESCQFHLALPVAIRHLATSCTKDCPQSLIEALLAQGHRSLGLAAARWLALRPEYFYRYEFCEFLLKHGQIGTAIPLLQYLAYERNDDMGLRACELLLDLGEVDLVVSILSTNIVATDASRRYQAALALALTGQDSSIAPPLGVEQAELCRSELKRNISHEHLCAFREAQQELGRLMHRALEETGTETAVPRALERLARSSAGWLATPPIFDVSDSVDQNAEPSAVQQVLAVPLDLFRGRVEEARESLAGLLVAEETKISSPVRQEIMAWAGRVFSSELTPAAVQNLRSADTSFFSAAQTLAEIGDSAAVGPLLAAFREFPGRALILKEILKEVADSSTLDLLVAALRDDSENIRSAAANALGGLGDPSSIKPLATALHDDSSMVRSDAARALGAIGDPSSVTSLAAIMRVGGGWPAVYAAEALGVIGDPAAIEALVAALSNGSKMVCSAAARALGAIGDPSASEPLVGALRDDSSQVRSRAAQALGKINDRSAIEPLAAALRDPVSAVRSAAGWALGAVNDPAAVESLAAAHEDSSAEVRFAAALGLAHRGDHTSIATLLTKLGAEKTTERANAVRSLGVLRVSNTEAAILAALADNDALVRLSAATTLGRFEPNAVVREALISILRDDSYVATAAVCALGRLGDPAAVSALMMGLVDLRLDPFTVAPALARLQAHRALALLETCARPHPRFITALINLRPSSALAVLDRHADRVRCHSWALRLRGQALWRQGDNVAAHAMFRKSIEHEENADNLLTLAHFHLERGKIRTAADLLDQALSCRSAVNVPTPLSLPILERKRLSPVVVLSRAVVHLLQGDLEAANRRLTQARLLDPFVDDPGDLKFDHFWRAKALIALQDLMPYDQHPVPASEVAEPRATYDATS